MKKGIMLPIALLIIFVHSAQSQEKQNFKIMCYNVENYFDCVDDSLTDDAEYLPTGMRGWNNSKYQKKQANIGKVIVAIGGWEAPALVGFCEIESEKCLFDLTRYSGLKNLRYKYLHHESPDARGVDVALLYQPSMFKPFHNEAIKIDFPQAPTSKTRDVLFASGVIPTGDTLHVFVCHFPSRLGGELESEERRIFVASVVRSKVDSLFAAKTNPNIVIMGDFNDYPTNKSMLEVLKAKPLNDSISSQELYNLMYKLHTEGKGSNKHNGEWGALDQMIISGNLLNFKQRFYTKPSDAHFFDVAFLLEDDKTFLGKQPFRTYIGMKYQEGFSDHLPVYADFWY
jgi:predicted extracellular nuclease